MIWLRRTTVALAAASGMATAAASAPLEAYGRLPSMEDVAISPDGATLGLIFTDGEQRKVVIQKVGETKPMQVFTVGNVKLRDVSWVSPNHLLLIKSDTSIVWGLSSPRREYAMAFVYDVAARKIHPLLKDQGSAMNVIYGAPQVRTIDGKPVIFLQGVYFASNRGRLALFRVDLEKFKTRLVDGDAQDANDWAIDAKGEILARTEYDSDTGRWRLKMRTPEGWRSARALEALIERPDLSGLGRDGDSVLVSQIENGKTTLREIPRGALSWGEPLPLEGYAALRDPADHTLIGTYALAGDEERYNFIRPNDQRVWKAIQKAYPNQRVKLSSWSADRKRIVVLVDSPTEGPAYALVDLGARRAEWLGPEYGGIAAGDVAEVKPVRFKAQDGLELTGYLTLPRGREAKNLPLVVFPHGGPAARDRPGFDWWAQAMASRGYAVLQVNFRGSDGFGWEFLSAGFGQWGRKMQTDLSDGVRHLAKDGTIDSRRVCIVGGSYGGYAALAGVTLDRGVYRCAGAIAGPSDLPRMVAYSRRQGGQGAQRFWLRFMGADKIGDDALDAISPVRLAAQADAPILLVHGRDDTVVPLDQSRMMADALKKAGRPVEFVTLAGDDHWLSRGETRLQMLRTVIAFLEKHNPPS